MVMVPREWLSKREPPRPMMSVSLGSSGERNGRPERGRRAAGRVAPPPERSCRCRRCNHGDGDCRAQDAAPPAPQRRPRRRLPSSRRARR
jgi:hypothetical protein